MATPVTAAAAIYEVYKIATGHAGVTVEMGAVAVGLVASLVSGLIAIGVLLRYLRTRSTDIFVAYRIALAAIVLVVWLR